METEIELGEGTGRGSVEEGRETEGNANYKRGMEEEKVQREIT